MFFSLPFFTMSVYVFSSSFQPWEPERNVTKQTLSCCVFLFFVSKSASKWGFPEREHLQEHPSEDSPSGIFDPGHGGPRVLPTWDSRWDAVAVAASWKFNLEIYPFGVCLRDRKFRTIPSDPSRRDSIKVRHGSFVMTLVFCPKLIYYIKTSSKSLTSSGFCRVLCHTNITL